MHLCTFDDGHSRKTSNVSFTPTCDFWFARNLKNKIFNVFENIH